jgi:diguanylate cyclase (GGDEF)-like protein/PAS domain S-box-containing protein
MSSVLGPVADLIDILPDAVLVVDARGVIVLANDAVAAVLGYDAQSLVGEPLNCLIPEDCRARHDELVAGYIATGRARLAKSRPVLQARHRSAARVPVSISLNNLDLNGERFSVAVIRDARGVHDQIEQAVAQAETDALTGIGNRLRLTRRIAEWIAADRPFGLLYFDLAGFKPFNDRHGHHVGDEVLRLVARRAQAMVRAQDLAVRIGGDEFVILLAGMEAPRLLEARAASVAASLCRPFHVDKVIGAIGVSIGGARFPREARSEQALLSIADARMYRAKQSGQSCWADAAAGAPGEDTVER